MKGVKQGARSIKTAQQSAKAAQQTAKAAAKATQKAAQAAKATAKAAATGIKAAVIAAGGWGGGGDHPDRLYCGRGGEVSVRKLFRWRGPANVQTVQDVVLEIQADYRNRQSID